MHRKTGLWIALWLVLVVVTGYFAFFHRPFEMGYGPWHGWGMTDRWGYEDETYPAYRSRGWQGMPPGWMGGWPDGGEGRSYGMMGPYGGVMPGMGLGMPGPMMSWSLPDLTAEQSEKIAELQSALAERNRILIQQVWETQARLNTLYASGKRDWDTIRRTSQKLFDLQRQQHESIMEFQQKVDGLLTDDQRQEMVRPQRGYGWMGRQ